MKRRNALRLTSVTPARHRPAAGCTATPLRARNAHEDLGPTKTVNRSWPFGPVGSVTSVLAASCGPTNSKPPGRPSPFIIATSLAGHGPMMAPRSVKNSVSPGRSSNDPARLDLRASSGQFPGLLYSNGATTDPRRLTEKTQPRSRRRPTNSRPSRKKKRLGAKDCAVQDGEGSVVALGSQARKEPIRSRASGQHLHPRSVAVGGVVSPSQSGVNVRRGSPYRLRFRRSMDLKSPRRHPRHLSPHVGDRRSYGAKSGPCASAICPRHPHARLQRFRRNILT